MDRVTVAIPTLPSRGGLLLTRAIPSVLQQTRPADALAVAADLHGEGAAVTRNRALAMVRTKWTAFLDDDDAFKPEHLERLLDYALATEADLAYPGYEATGGQGELRPLGAPFDPDFLREANYIPVTVLVKTKLVLDVFGFENVREPDHPDGPCEDWGCWLKLVDHGAKFVHLPERTWVWHTR